MRGDVLLDARRSIEGAASARMMVSVLRGDELWTVELSQLRPDGMSVDADFKGPGGVVHAAVVLRANARVTRRGEVLTETATLRAAAFTTGFHADDGTFRALSQARSGDLELLVHLEALPGQGPIDIGFDRPEIWLDGVPVPEDPVAETTAPDWPEAWAPRGTAGASAASGALPDPGTSNQGPRLPTAAVGGTGTPVNAAGAAPAPVVTSPGNLGGTRVLPGSVAPVNAAGAPAAPVVASPWNAGGAQAAAGTSAPVNAAGAMPNGVPSGPGAANSAPVLQSPSAPGLAPGGSSDVPRAPVPASSPPRPLVPEGIGWTTGAPGGGHEN